MMQASDSSQEVEVPSSCVFYDVRTVDPVQFMATRPTANCRPSYLYALHSVAPARHVMLDCSSELRTNALRSGPDS